MFITDHSTITPALPVRLPGPVARAAGREITTVVSLRLSQERPANGQLSSEGSLPGCPRGPP